MSDLRRIDGTKARQVGADRASAYAGATILWVLALVAILAAPAVVLATYRWAL